MTALPLESEYVNGNGFVAEVIRSNRRKNAMITVEAGLVSVKVPDAIDSARIERLLKDKRRWIKEKIALHKEHQPVSDKSFISGESFSYLGRNYRLKVIKGSYRPPKLKNGYILVTVPEGSKNPSMVRNALVRWYCEKAEAKLTEKAKRYAQNLGVSPRSVKIKHYKTKWGSCSKNGDIYYNWRIMMAPNAMVDYVVIHELCHLVHHDHSTQFWNLLNRQGVDYRLCRAWLKDNASKLDF